MDIDTILTRFEREYLAPNSITPGRRKQQAALLRRLAATLDGPLTELTAADANTFIGFELERGIHPNTCRKYVGMVRSFATWGEQSGVLPHTAELKLLRNPRGSSALNAPRPYKPSEIRQLYVDIAAHYPALPVNGRGSRALKRFLAGEKTGIRNHLWRHARRLQLEAQVSLALELGLRRIEIMRCTVAAIHYDNSHVVVLTAKQEPGRRVTRIVPHTPHSRQVVQEWLDLRALLAPPHEHPWLALPVQGRTVEQVRPQTIYGLERALSLCGGWSWHRLRHTAATEWLRAGVPMEKVMPYMGHHSIEQTRAYTEINDDDVELAFERAQGEFARRLGLAA